MVNKIDLEKHEKEEYVDETLLIANERNKYIEDEDEI